MMSLRRVGRLYWFPHIKAQQPFRASRHPVLADWLTARRSVEGFTA